MEPQQSPLYSAYMKSLKWDVISVDGVNAFIKKFPLMGGIIKIHRPAHLPDIKKLIPICKKYAVRRIVIEPVATENQKIFSKWLTKIKPYISINTSPFLPTKTIRIDLNQTEEQIFQSFSEAKRRGVRRAQKNSVVIAESSDISELIHIKNKSGGFFGFITTTGIKELWHFFSPSHAAIILAKTLYPKNHIIAGVLLLYWDHVAYYWIAGATKEGKTLFAPTLLVWEAVKLAKKNKCKTFDFVGVWDERIPKENTSWHGFTKFKEGFGGKTMYYPLVPRFTD
jgi:lipid II:glycine glycyltransferase (peptidoglycan interpeptide bridge formation enzyme)